MAAIKEKALKTVGGAAARRAQGDRPGAYKGLRRRDRRGRPDRRRRLPIVAELRPVPPPRRLKHKEHSTEGEIQWLKR